MKTVPLNLCEYDKRKRVLMLASEYFGMPEEFDVVSHHTGRSVRFSVVTEDDPLFDHDHWDGEMCIYRPVPEDTKIDHLIIYHQY